MKIGLCMTVRGPTLTNASFN